MCVPALEEEGRAEGWQRKLSWRDLTLLDDGEELYPGKGSERYVLWATHRIAKWTALLATHTPALSMALSVATHQETALLATQHTALVVTAGNCATSDTSHCTPRCNTPHCSVSWWTKTICNSTKCSCDVVWQFQVFIMKSHKCSKSLRYS